MFNCYSLIKFIAFSDKRVHQHARNPTVGVAWWTIKQHKKMRSDEWMALVAHDPRVTKFKLATHLLKSGWHKRDHIAVGGGKVVWAAFAFW